jgi:hypothetical protein
MGKKAAVVPVLLSVLLVSSVASAAVMLKMELADLVSESDAVVQGRVLGAKSEWNADRTKISTTATIEIVDCLKGGLSGRVEVTTLGGEVGNVGQKVSGMPVFRKGDEAVIFLKKIKAGYEVTGYNQGRYEVVREQGKDPVVQNDFEGMSLAPKDEKGRAAGLAAVPAPVKRPLADFVADIKAAIK